MVLPLRAGIRAEESLVHNCREEAPLRANDNNIQDTVVHWSLVDMHDTSSGVEIWPQR